MDNSFFSKGKKKGKSNPINYLALEDLTKK
jgi:hypothetical protein